MKVVFLSRQFFPDIGGVEKHVLEISKQLIARGHDVTVISEGLESQNFSLFQKQTKIHVYKISVGRDEKKKKFLIWKWFWKNRQLLQNADIIHCHDVFYWYLPFRFLYPHKPVFTTFHGYENFPIKKKAILIRKISEKLSRGNICIGDFIKKWYGTKSTFISYGAVNVKTIDSRLRENDTKTKKDSAVFFGRLDEQTGILTYQKAITILRKKFPKFTLLIIGNGKYKKLISKKNNILPFRNNPEKYLPHYHFAFVSRYLSMLEAFAAKRLVFAVYDNPLKEDYLKMSPFAKFIIIVNTPEDLAKRVAEILQNPQQEKVMIDTAYDWVKKQSWEEMTKLYLKLWKN